MFPRLLQLQANEADMLTLLSYFLSVCQSSVNEQRHYNISSCFPFSFSAMDLLSMFGFYYHCLVEALNIVYTGLPIERCFRDC
ncbi:hypothetical protein BJ912DRAFT_584710 [Pholiota molesta]|nr:hypothetical protein BJ912DRAFT_584710 [Pholiota molesta]